MAATNIQTPINLTIAGDTVWVSNGVYNTGGVTNYPTDQNVTMTTRVAITKAIIVRSANNDPANTIIKGAWDATTNGPAAVRCVYVASSASLIGFTLTNGAAGPSTGCKDRGGGAYAGGTYCDKSSTISNCVITGNSAGVGGGVCGGTVYNCLIVGNSAPAGYGGGVSSVNCINCIVYNNTPNNHSINAVCTFTNSCTYPTQTTWTASMANITNNPQFVNTNTGDYHLSKGSPCIHAGANVYVTTNTPTDLDGKSRIDHFNRVVDMGCYEFLSQGMVFTGFGRR